MKLITKSLAMLLIATVCTAYTGNAQAFEKGKSYASIGYGFQLLPVKSLFKVYQDELGFKVKGMGPFAMKYEYAITDKVGIGLNIGFTNASIAWSDSSLNLSGNIENFNYSYKYSKLTITPRFNYHLGDNEKIDPYIGLGIGFKKASYKFTTSDPFFNGISFSGLPVSFEATFGIRGWFTDQIGAFAEIGAGHGFFQLGAVGKF